MPTKPTAVEMFDELVQLGYVHPANIEPHGFMAPTAYLTVPTTTAYFTPPVPEVEPTDAKLGPRPKGDPKPKRRPGRRVRHR
jgi:hypothetical protein